MPLHLVHPLPRIPNHPQADAEEGAGGGFGDGGGVVDIQGYGVVWHCPGICPRRNSHIGKGLITDGTNTSWSTVTHFQFFSSSSTWTAPAGVTTAYITMIGGGGSGSGATAFTGLSDVPASYSGQTGKTLTVNGGETGLQFSTAGNGDMTKAVDGANIATSTTGI